MEGHFFTSIESGSDPVKTVRVPQSSSTLKASTLDGMLKVVQPKQKKSNAGGSKKKASAVLIVQPSAQPKKGKTPRRRQRRSNGGGPGGPGRMFPSGTSSRARRTYTVTEDEFIATVNGSIAFAVTSFPINPGQAGTFPWLSKEASQWEKYKFNRLEFYFKPTVSAFNAQGQIGKLILGCDYDASDPPPTTKQQIEDTDPRADCMPYQECTLRLNPREMGPNSDAKFVRVGVPPARADIKTYDCGTLNVATSGNTGATEIGELRVRYSITFDVPVLESSTIAPRNYSVSQFVSTAPEGLTTGVSYQMLMATVTTNGLGVINTAGSFVPPVGNYLINVSAQFGTGTAYTTAALTLQKNNVNQTIAQTIIAAGALMTTTTQDITWWATANGTDAFAFDAVGVTAGAPVVSGTVSFTAI